MQISILGFFVLTSIILLTLPINQIIAEEIPRPIKQTSEGVLPEDVVCKENLVLILNNDSKPACVKPESVLKLVEVGWAPADTIDKISINDEVKRKVSEGVFSLQFDFCKAVYNQNALGVIVSSSVEKIPVAIDPELRIEFCHRYGAQIHSIDSSIITSLIYEKDLPELIKDFERKKMNLEDELVKHQQRLMRLQDPNLDGSSLEEIEKLKVTIDWHKDVIESCKEGLKTLSTFQ